MQRDHAETPLVSVGGVRVLVNSDRVEAAVLRGGFDALVSSDDTSLSMGGGVSKAILSAAGSSIAEEAAHLTPLTVGDVAVTSAGALPARYILHAATVDWAHGIMPTDRTLRLAGENLFRRCESLAIRRIAIPALATGAGRFSPEHSARLILASLADHVQSPTVLQEVVFCLPDEEVRQAFVAGIDAELPGAELSTGDALDGAPAFPRSQTLERPASAARPLPRATTPPPPPPVGRPPGAARQANADLRDPTVVMSVPGRPRTSARRGVPSLAVPGSFRGILALFERWFRRESPATLDLGAPLYRGPAAPTTGSATSVAREPREGLTRAGPTVDATTTLPRTTVAVQPSLTRSQRPVLGGRYVLLEEIGRGGMGVVHLAWDIVLRHVVAIKTLRARPEITAAQAEGLRREAQLQIELSHDGIVRLLHFEPWEQSVGPYIIMEYLAWSSGDRWIAEAGSLGLPVHSVVRVGMRLSDALAYAHSAGIVHGDIKPRNIFVDPAGDRAKLADFGIARVVGTKQRDALVTRLAGTPAYMAPEQKSYGARIGPWTDIYLLARTLADLLGWSPEKADDGSAVHGDGSLIEPVIAVLRRGLATAPEERPKGADEFGSLLAGALQAVT
jgi:O-acetyl-ADP-ribose deacetylase (regulator of RNase III)